MPPVPESWDKALRRAFAENKQRGEGPTTFRQLHIAMGGNADDRKRTVNRLRKSNRAREATAVAISRALGVSRSQLPAAANPPSTWELEDRLEELAAQVRQLDADARAAHEETLAALKEFEVEIAALRGQRGSLPMRGLRNESS